MFLFRAQRKNVNTIGAVLISWGNYRKNSKKIVNNDLAAQNA